MLERVAHQLIGLAAYVFMLASYSDNQYLATMFDVSSALTVKTLVPLSCYWALVTGVAWGALVVLAPSGYRIIGAEHISRHLYFNIIEVSVLCMQLVSRMAPECIAA